MAQGQFSRPIAQIDALLDELVSARGGYSTLSAALASKADDSEITEITAAIAALATAVVSKQSLSCGTAVTQDDMDDVVITGSYSIAAASVQGIANLPTGISGDLRVDVIELPGNLRQQMLRSAGSTPGIYIRNSTTAPAPATESLIPAMTSDTAPSGEVIESGHYQTRYGWYAFDGTDSQTWSSSAWDDGTNLLDGTADACYVGYIWDTEQTVSTVKITFSSDTAYTGCIQCRIAGVWQTIVSDIPVANTGYTVVERTLETPAECDAIRFCVLSGSRERFAAATYGGNVCEFTVYGDSGLTATWGDWKQITVASIV